MCFITDILVVQSPHNYHVLFILLGLEIKTDELFSPAVLLQNISPVSANLPYDQCYLACPYFLLLFS